MKYQIDKSSGVSAYMQLYDQLRRDIARGSVKYGERMPSKRLLAGELGVSLITVEHAYALLVDEGYAEARERSGYFAAFGGRAETSPSRALRCRTRRPCAYPEDFPFSVLAKVMRRVLTEYDRRILMKPPGAGCAELRAAIAAYLERSRGVAVSPERIIIGSGAEYLYSLIAQLLGGERGFALEKPCYEVIRRVYEANGVECTELAMGEDGIISSELSGCAAGVLHVTPFNSYPSHVTAPASKRHEYARWARAHGGVYRRGRLRFGVLLGHAADRHDLFSRTGAGDIRQHLFKDPRARDAHGVHGAAGGADGGVYAPSRFLFLHRPGL